MELNTGSGRNLRSESILNELDIKNREILSSAYNEADYCSIDWKNVNKKIEQKRFRALEYLKNINC